MSLEQPVKDNTIANTKLKLGFLNSISGEWFNYNSDKLEISKSIKDVDYIIYESNGDPIHIIEKIKYVYPKDKLVFILSGDQNGHIDNECIWFTNAVKPSGLAAKQTQVFVTNPAIFKFYEKKIKNITDYDITSLMRQTDIYFKGTIWSGMRTDMYREFVNKPNCSIIANNNYWKWRCESPVKPTQKQLEETAYESYNDILNSKLCLCPKGNGNSSMRIIEALACGSIPILINDFSAPFGMSWGGGSNDSTDAFCLVFDTNKHTWEYIYDECMRLINDRKRYDIMCQMGKKYFENVIYCDSKLNGFKMYNNIDTVCFGFSKIIIDKLIDIKNKRKI